MMLSENFRLEELIRSDEAIRQCITNAPGADEIDNLRRLCALVLEPLRAAIGRPVTVTSGYRSPLLNVVIGGSPTSDHCHGRAADIKVAGMPARDVCEAIQLLDLPFRQVIHEFGAWCHVSIPSAGDVPRREVLTAIKAGGKTQYMKGLV